MIAKGVSMARVAQMLSSLTRSPVMDETHVSSVFDFNLDWTPDAGRTGADGQAASADPAAGESLSYALQHQLGLKLEARKIATEFILIDHAENPPKIKKPFRFFVPAME